MSYFETTALPLILIFEGGFTDDPVDKGGRTNKGIIKKVYDAYRVAKKLPPADVKDITNAEVAEIYMNNYWLPSKCDKMADKLATTVFDTSVNMGCGRSIKFIQQSIGAKVDGVIGPETISKLAAMDQVQLTNTFLSNREAFYRAIVKRDPTQIRFLNGWLRRLNFVKDFVTGVKTLDQIKKAW